MNSANKHQSIINVIAYTIENDEQGIRDLLKRNGVKTNLILNKRQLSKAFIDALSKSRTLAVDFTKYLNAKKKSHSLSISGGYANFNTSIADMTLGIEQQIKESQQAEQEQPKTGFFSGLNLKDLINSTVQVLEMQKDIKVSEANKAAVEAAVQAKRDEIDLGTGLPKTGMSTGTVVTIVIAAVVVIGLVAWGYSRAKAGVKAKKG